MKKKTLEQYKQEFDTLYQFEKEEPSIEKLEEYEKLANACIVDYPDKEIGYIALGKALQKIAKIEHTPSKETIIKIEKISHLAKQNKYYIKTLITFFDCDWFTPSPGDYDIYSEINPNYAALYNMIGNKYLINSDYVSAGIEFANAWRCGMNFKSSPYYQTFLHDMNYPIQNFHIKKYHCIEDLKIEENLENCKEIYFLGENGVGKTILLQSIIEMIPFSPDENKIGILNIERADDPQRKNYLNLFAYGTARFRTGSDKDDYFDKTGNDTLFDRNKLLTNPIQFFKDVDYSATKKLSPLKIETVLQAFEEIIDFDNTKNFKIQQEGINFIFYEKGRRTEFNHLAEGYRSVLIWLCDLLSRLIENQPYIDDLKDFYGIVLVDEIDMFLHPKWEYKIVGKLRKKLPNIQWFFTTHSPMLILGASEDAVIYKMVKDENGKTQKSNQWTVEEIQHLMANAIITSPLFDLPTAKMSSLKNNDKLDTTDNYWIAKIYEKIKLQVEREKSEPKISPKEIDKFVLQMIDLIDKEAGV